MTDPEYAGCAWDYEAIRRMNLGLPYETEPIKPRRVVVPWKLRYEMLEAQAWCSLCGSTAGDGTRLEIDHIDGNSSNTVRANLQVLCHECNVGKGSRPQTLPSRHDNRGQADLHKPA